MHYNQRSVNTQLWFVQRTVLYNTLSVAKTQLDAIQGVPVSHSVAVVGHSGRQPQFNCKGFSSKGGSHCARTCGSVITANGP